MGGRSLSDPQDLTGHRAGEVRAAEYIQNADGASRIATGGFDGILIWDPSDRSFVVSNAGDVYRLAWHPTLKLLAAGTGTNVGLVNLSSDSQPPILTVSPQVTQVPAGTSSVTLTVSASDASPMRAVHVSVNGVETEYTASAGQKSASIQAPVTLVMGQNQIVVAVADIYANTSTTTLHVTRIDDLIGPLVGNVLASPGLASSGSVFTLTAGVRDESGVGSVIAVVKRPDQSTLSTVGMRDDGSNGDLAAGDLVFTGRWDSTGVPDGRYGVDIVASDLHAPPNASSAANAAVLEVKGAVLVVTPPEIDFGAVVVSETRELDFTLANTGGAAVTGNATAAPPFAVVQGGAFTIEPGGSALARVRFAPTSAGTAVGTASFTHAGGSVTRALRGVGEVAQGGTPEVTAIAPTGGSTTGGTVVTITGSGFATGATVTIGGVAATTPVVVNATTITATTPPHAAGLADVMVTNPDAQSATLVNGFSYVVEAQNPRPVLTGLVPDGVTAGTGALSLTVTGADFTRGSVVRWNGTSRATDYLSETQLTASIPASDVATAGAANVSVFTPPPGGGESSSRAFTIRGALQSWTRRAPIPVAQDFVVAEAIGGYIYAGLGALPGESKGYFHRYDPVTDSWVSLTQTPGDTYERTSASFGGRLFAFGGVEHGGPLAKVEVYDPATDQWASLPDMPSPHVAGAAATVNGVTYVLGGSYLFGAHASSTANDAYDFATNTWTQRQPMPRPRSEHTAASAGGKVYVFGGNGGSVENAPTPLEVDVYDPATDTWATAPPECTMRRVRVSPASIALANGHVLLIGGSNPSEGTLASVEEFDPVSCSWQERVPLSVARAALSAVVINGQVYAIAGHGQTYLDVVEAIGLTALTSSTGLTVTVVSPTSGPTTGGTVVTLTGAGFVTGATVTIGGMAATGVTVVNATTITATMSAHAAGAVDIVVTNPDSQTAMLPGGFTYVAPTTPVVTWANPASIVYGRALSSTQLNATANVAGTFVYTPASGTVLNVGTGQTLSVTFTPTDTASYTTAAKSVTIDVTKATPVVTWANPASIVSGTPLGDTQLNATANVAGTFVYSPPAGTVLGAGAGQTLSVTFTPTDAANYTTATKTVLIDVVAGPPTITSFTPASGPIGTVVTLTGTGFTGATAVTFNGVTAAHSMVSDTQITATVPAGTTTGPVRVTTPGGTATSAANFEVTNQRGTRTLPVCYVPEYALTVTVDVGPAPEVQVQALEEQPPAGWTLGAISDGGAWDSVNAKLKWGPFFDATARAITYVLTPPAEATGAVTFAGMVSFDGAEVPVGGTKTLGRCESHPADVNGDFRLVIGEVTGYGSAWKRGLTWAVPPVPIPIGYVTRAGYLWRMGETYQRDAGACPACWMPLTAVPLPLPDGPLLLDDIPTPHGGPWLAPEPDEGSSRADPWSPGPSVIANSVGGPPQPCPPPRETLWRDLGEARRAKSGWRQPDAGEAVIASAPASTARRTRGGVATRQLPATYAPKAPLAVTIEVTPHGDVQAWAVEEVVPAGWRVSDLSADEHWDEAASVVRSGPFFEEVPQTLRYTLTPPAGAIGPQECDSQLHVGVVRHRRSRRWDLRSVQAYGLTWL